MAIIAILEIPTRTVNIAELKNKLSSYLTYAKAGETIIIRDRNRPVAKLIPFVAGDTSDEDLALVAAGMMRLPEKQLDVEEFLKMPRPVVVGSSATQALLDDRYESR